MNEEDQKDIQHKGASSLKHELGTKDTPHHKVSPVDQRAEHHARQAQGEVEADGLHGAAGLGRGEGISPARGGRQHPHQSRGKDVGRPRVEAQEQSAAPPFEVFKSKPRNTLLLC